MKKNGPWTIRSSEIKYKNPWIVVREDQVIQPSGKEGIYGVVTQTPGISVLAIDAEGLAYLVNEFRYALERNSLETVSGAIEVGEEPLDAAKRELKEEVGAIATSWVDFGWLDPLSSVVRCPQRLYLAQGLSFSESKLDDNEYLEMKKVLFSDAVKMVLNNEITYAPTCVLILKVNEYIKTQGV